MLPIHLAAPGGVAGGVATPIRRILVLGAHCDDIEIGCGGTILELVEHHRPLSVYWLVLSGTKERAKEAEASAAAFLSGVDAQVVVRSFRDGFFPWSGGQIKEVFEELKGIVAPDVIFTHRREDAHQDHRLVAELTWNTFRDHLILEYEIPKYEGDLGAPNLFVPLEERTGSRKVELLLKGYPSQRHRKWFDADTFWSILRLRGLESNSPSRYAEGFYCRKLVLPMTPPVTTT
jgi:LmbE family N-acetylglucosaminyl deacetylase